MDDIIAEAAIFEACCKAKPAGSEIEMDFDLKGETSTVILLNLPSQVVKPVRPSYNHLRFTIRRRLVKNCRKMR